MAVLEYLTGNSLIAYPFKDGGRLQAVDNHKLGHNVLLDALIIPKNRIYVRAYLKATTNTSLSIALVDKDYNEIVEVINTTGALTYQTITHTSSNSFIKLVPGNGLAGIGSHSFVLGKTEFATSAVLAITPSVSRIEFYNYIGSGNTLYDFTENGTNIITTDNCIIKEGANLNFELAKNNTGAEMYVVPKGGTGLYDGCLGGGNGAVINTINHSGPNTFGNFNILTDECYNTIPHVHGIELDHTCTPKCNSGQLQAYGHYLNRVKDGMVILGGRVNQIETYLEQQINAYQDYLEEQAEINAAARPTLHGKYLISSSTTEHFYSVAVGIYNPMGSPLDNITLTVSAPAPLVYVNGTAKIDNKEDFIPITPSTRLGIAIVNGVDVPCHDSIIYNFVLKIPATQSSAGPITVTLTCPVTLHNPGSPPIVENIEVVEVIGLVVPPPVTTTTRTTTIPTTTTTTTPTTTTTTTTTPTTTTTTTTTTALPLTPNFVFNKTININFGSADSGHPAVLDLTLPTSFWNSFIPPNILPSPIEYSRRPGADPLLYQDNASSNVVITWKLINATSYATATLEATNAMYNTSLSLINSQFNPKIEIKISNLSDNATYDLVVFAHGRVQDRNCKITIEKSDVLLSGATPSSNPGLTTIDSSLWKSSSFSSANLATSNQQFVRYTGIVIPSGAIPSIKIIIESDHTPGHVAINGLQLKRTA